ncbi:hypothetical protein [Nocardia goodfellowii]|uniref:Uncharacterized protein n=1 Tax=Nocardia goodfellowii TaxID=882446 RepID=A0ABS4QP12_9NOCA|nr:hypothetical protein [Nocardia goodfellowii]MBP2192875.1 hypothetical protein [Nocardia goodfellowii]
MTTTGFQRISRLRALIDHPRTGPDERATAQRMLDRILSRSGAVTADSTRAYGTRHRRLGKHADLAAVAEMIRDDIALARTMSDTPAAPGDLAPVDPLGDAPAQLTFVVSTPHPGAIDITIDDIPQAWGWADSSGAPTAALQSLATELADILHSYNHSGADLPPRFFGRVRAGNRTLIW